MALIDRVKNVCLTPSTEWPVIDTESATPGGLVTGYAAPLMAIPAVAGFIGGSLVGYSLFGGTFRVPLTTGLTGAVLTFVLGLVGLFVLSFIINALAPTFGGQQDSTKALKVAVYSYTPALVAGVFGILPALGVLAVLGGLYGLYLLYLGLPVLMKSPPEKSLGYTAVVVVCAIVLMVVVGSIVGALGFGAGAMAGGFGRGPVPGASGATFDPDSPIGRIEQMGRAMEQRTQEMEQARARGDEAGAAGAAMGSLGAILGGGRTVDPLDIDTIRSFVPATFAGLSREGGGRAEKNGMGGLMVSKAEARYVDGGRSVELEITDAGGASALMGLASWAAAGSVKDDDDETERTDRINGRLTHIRQSKTGGTNEYAVFVADRFMVAAKSDELSAEALGSAVASLDLRRLESLKDAGVQK